MSVIVVLLAAIGIYVAAVIVANRFTVPRAVAEATFSAAAEPVEAGDLLSLATWNVGYAGMGVEADFVMDLGQQTRPVEAALVDRNLVEIAAEVSAFDVDVIFFQEAAEPSYSSHGRDILAGLRRALPNHGWMYAPEVRTKLVPPPLKSSVGNAIFARVAVDGAEYRALPLEPTFEYGAFRKGYKMHILRLSGPQRWVLINVHLSTFDSAEADVRGAQVDALMQFAQAEHANGAHVVIGGDWNLRLSQSDFPHTTEERFQFWIRDFPAAKVPDGWQWAVDQKVPTVRTAHKPYVQGENYALIVDGFLVSPNVAVETVKATDLGFEHTDHHPVMVHLSAN